MFGYQNRVKNKDHYYGGKAHGNLIGIHISLHTISKDYEKIYFFNYFLFTLNNLYDINQLSLILL